MRAGRLGDADDPQPRARAPSHLRRSRTSARSSHRRRQAISRRSVQRSSAAGRRATFSHRASPSPRAGRFGGCDDPGGSEAVDAVDGFPDQPLRRLPSSLTTRDRRPVFRVPYAGLMGDYQAIVAMPTGHVPRRAATRRSRTRSADLRPRPRTRSGRSRAGRGPERADPLRPPGATARAYRSSMPRPASSAAPAVLQRAYEQNYLSRNQTADRGSSVPVGRWPAPLERAGARQRQGPSTLEDHARRPVQADRQGAEGAR